MKKTMYYENFGGIVLTIIITIVAPKEDKILIFSTNEK